MSNMKSIPEGHDSHVAYSQFEDTNPLLGGGALPAGFSGSGAGSSSGKDITLTKLESADDLEYFRTCGACRTSAYIANMQL